jgi:uncharacterized protein (DUF924 family)
MERWREIYDFWFGAPGSDERGTARDMWFGGGPEVDREIRERFEDDYRRAAAGGYSDWRNARESALALVVTLDQFPRNIYRGDPRSFAADAEARAVARHIVAQPWHAGLLAVERVFAYLPFEHSEDLADQRRSVELFESIGPHSERENWIDYAVRHLEIVERFGRFPHRNAILGRESRPEEDDWLARDGERFGTDASDPPAEKPGS